MFSQFSTFYFLTAFISLATSLPLAKRGFSNGPVIESNFPDPAYIQVGGTYFAFSTNSGGLNVPIATSSDFTTWTVTNEDALPDLPSWTDGAIWAPHVVSVGDGFVLYYSASVKGQDKHCVGVATSKEIKGPYFSLTQPLACPLDQGGAIDPAGFNDPDGTRYVVYKVDGNSLGGGGACGNGDYSHGTPIMLQKLKANGVTTDGNPVQILDRDDADGPLVEAPSLVYAGGQYVLFFSSNCFNGDLYDTSYAIADDVAGPYTKVLAPDAPLLVTGGAGGKLYSPGGAMVGPEGTSMVFHSDLKRADPGTRQMWTTGITIQKGRVLISAGPAAAVESVETS